jgi:hypothetical protein
MDRRGDSGGYELLRKGTDDRGPGWSVMALELFKIKVSCWFLLDSPTTVCLYTDSCRQTCMHAQAYSSGLDPYCLYTRCRVHYMYKHMPDKNVAQIRYIVLKGAVWQYECTLHFFKISQGCLCLCAATDHLFM